MRVNDRGPTISKHKMNIYAQYFVAFNFLPPVSFQNALARPVK